MHVRFLLGPAGSGKTFRCLAEIREDLKQHPEGPDLILLAPKQATFQLERQLLADGSLQGYTRLQILSFERLAAYVFDRLGKPPPELLSEEGRVMVLRALLEANHAGLRVFHASARLSGFARQLSAVLRELQRRQLGPQSLETLAAQPGLPLPLSHKLSDLALILRGYLEWIGAAGEGRLEDAACLLDVAATALHRPPQPLKIGGLWLDGFAEMTPQEHALLAALLPHCAGATLAFCLPQAPSGDEPWLSPWAVVSETAHECALRVRNLVGTTVAVEQLERDPSRSRFSTAPSLARLEQVMGGATHCAADVPSADEPSGSPGHEGCGPIRETSLEKMDLPAGRRQHVGDGDAMTRVPPEPEGRRDACAMFPLRLIECSNLEAEARLAAREILGFVQEGGRFRDCAILVRSLDGYQDALRRVLTRYDIPFFLDRREPVSHHPLAELTRFA